MITRPSFFFLIGFVSNAVDQPFLEGDSLERDIEFFFVSETRCFFCFFSRFVFRDFYLGVLHVSLFHCL